MLTKNFHEMGIWSALPMELQVAVISRVGGERLGQTVQLGRVCQHFRRMIPIVVRCLVVDECKDARVAAIDATIAVAELGRPGSTQVLIERAACDADKSLRKVCLDALSYLVMKDDPEASEVAIMAARALQDPFREVRRAALSLLKSLVQRGDPVAVDAASIIAEVAANCSGAESAELRQDAMEAVGALLLHGDSAVVRLITRCVNDACCGVRHQAILALGEVAPRGDPEAVNLLHQHLQYPDVVTRRVAATSCAKIAPVGDQNTVIALANCSCDDVDASVRVFALDAISVVAQMGDPQALEAARACFQDGDVSVQRAALRVIDKLAGEPSAIQ